MTHVQKSSELDQPEGMLASCLKPFDAEGCGHADLFDGLSSLWYPEINGPDRKNTDANETVTVCDAR